ncbi:hypothetical protein RvY_13734-2 [Ramazzottius varieornatus]|uniref:TRUD domain-containing protein n=1 Tax=Ramazzottius varieornatus TaxID=947166 RepID=A0A1D1VU44_RAMVA|nr:hypothetical protein RvY_13734-2 [Ramazzottius varieornatus]
MVFQAPDNKERRRLLHHQLEAHFHQDRLLRTPKKNADGAQAIEISRASGSSEQFRRQEASRNRQSPCDHIHFTLYKENMDTMEVVNNMGGFLRVPPRCIQYAGVKDKRAKTVQRVSIKFRDPQRLAQFSRNSIRLGNFTFEKEPLHLGDLTGNYFRLVIRNVTADEDTIRASTDAFVKQGFVNYFGLQRFGTTEVSTVEVGKALLKADWNAAVEAIMKERSNEHERVQRCRKVWAETKDAEAALKAIGNRSCIEAQLLQGLARSHKNDPFGAIQNISRNTRLMYVHSYQSYLWNLAVSYRLRTLGRKPAAGDLVVRSSAEPSAKRLRTSEKQEDDVVVVTSDNVEQYSFSDVVMPIPGYDVQYPDNAVSKYLFELMEADVIDLRAKHKVKDYSLAGCYRRVICRPTDASWQIIRYNDVNQDLQLSDLDLLEGKVEEPKKNEGIHTAVAVKFTLPSSTYATMAIREMLKRSSDHKFTGKNLTADEPLDQDFYCDTSIFH